MVKIILLFQLLGMVVYTVCMVMLSLCWPGMYSKNICEIVNCIIARSKRDGTCAETRFGLSAKWTSPFKSVGLSVQSTTDSRGVRISGQRLYRPWSDVQCKAAGYLLHSHLSPSLPLPCVIRFQMRYTNDSTDILM